jgi:uncharacterized protein
VLAPLPGPHRKPAMKTFTIALVLAASMLAAQAQEPTAESVERLLVVTRTERMMEQVFSQMESGMRQGLQQSLQGQTLSDEQRKVIDYAPTRFVNVMRDELSWTAIKGDVAKVYRETFTQPEIDALLVFYTSPAGVAFIEKMPLAMQRSGALMQQRMAPLIPKMQAAMQQAMADARLAR